MWSSLGPVPTACLLFLDAYYQAWSQQVSVACLPSTVPWMPHLYLNTLPSFSLSLCLYLFTPTSSFLLFPTFHFFSPTFHSLFTYIPSRASKEPCWWRPENPKQHLSLLGAFMLPQDPRQLVLEQPQGLLSLQNGQKAEASQY